MLIECAILSFINLLKPTGSVKHQQINIQQFYILPTHTVFMCFVFISEQTATCAPYDINWSVFITEMKSYHIRTVRPDIIKVFYSPTNAQVIVLKTILKFTLK
jgi:hypothetical protein